VKGCLIQTGEGLHVINGRGPSTNERRNLGWCPCEDVSSNSKQNNKTLECFTYRVRNNLDHFPRPSHMRFAPRFEGRTCKGHNTRR